MRTGNGNGSGSGSARSAMTTRYLVSDSALRLNAVAVCA